MTREQIIQQLVDGDIEQIKVDMLNEDWTVVAWNLEFGFRGYNDYTDLELATEVAERKAMAEQHG
jgi:hypothetical protein